jgi:hypothetical protein
MKFFFLILFFVILASSIITAQDTIYSTTNGRYKSTVLKNGYDLFFICESGEKLDTVFKYDYGAYMGVSIDEILVNDEHFVCIYSIWDMTAYTTFIRKRGVWEPNMGGPLDFVNDHIKRAEVSILSTDKIRVKNDKGSTVYKLNYTQKTLEVDKE